MYKPIIGIATNVSWVPIYGSLSRHVTLMSNANIAPIVESGGIPLLMPNLVLSSDISALVSSLDGILFPGGQDIDPAYYGNEQKVTYSRDVHTIGVPYLRPQMMAPDQNRDKFELAIYAEAKRQNKPILGVCRGMQLINVAESGTLFQEVAEVASIFHEVDDSGYNHHHEIFITEGSVFYEIFEARVCFGPSMHHQSVDKVGQDLVVSGRSSDGVVEFMEYKDRSKFIVGVQGDVERARKNLTGFERLYCRFIDECRQRSSNNKM